MKQLKALIRRVIPAQMLRALVPYYHLLIAVIASLRYARPARDMRVIGVTGTNGKTTTSFLIHRMLVEAGLDTALMSTVAYGVNNDIDPQLEHMTTVSAPMLNQRLAQMRQQGARWLVLETTSHALAQHRVWGVPYEIAVLTNITHEHLDYHGNFKHYLESKLRLFRIANRHGMRFGVINADDESAAVFSDAIKQSLGYGIQNGELKAEDIEMSGDGSRYTAVVDGDRYDIRCNIPGEFNVYNSLAAVAVGRKIGLSRDQIERGIAALTSVEGRMNTIDEGQDYSVIVDFAHTPDSFERLLSDLRKSTKGKLIVLFGSAGRRDESKRWTQGEIAGKYADELVLTEEDDRDIDGNLILSQIAEGAERSGKLVDQDMFLILDRPEAIRFAMTRATSANDVVVLLGKGHEKTIERADGEHPWDEVHEAREAIRATLETSER